MSEAPEPTCGCIEGNDVTLTTHAVCNCPVHGEAPGPTFLERLREARGVATPTPWPKAARPDADDDLIALLVNNAEKIAALIEAADIGSLNYIAYGTVGQESVNEAIVPAVALRRLAEALRALNEGVQ